MGWPYNTYFDGQETSFCEFSTDNGITDCDERQTGEDLNKCVGVSYYREECSSICGYQDITSVFECTETGCSCAESACDGLTIGSNITKCSSGQTYFADKCTSTASGEDRGDNICRSSAFGAGCIADSECNEVVAGSNNCKLDCRLNQAPSNTTLIGPNGGGTFDKQVLINWTISTDPNNDFVRYDLDYSNNSGVNWYNLIQNYGYENKLNDSSPNVTLNYIGNENKTVYLRIPKNSNVLSAKIDLTGFQSWKLKK